MHHDPHAPAALQLIDSVEAADTAFGSDVPFAEPLWYRPGMVSPFYNASHERFRQKVGL
jgi:hypothetical protein